MAEAIAGVIRFFHIMSGVLWVGGAFLWGMIIAPNVLQRGPPPIRRPFLEATLAKFTRLMIVAGGLTILTGFWTMGILVGWSSVVDVFQNGGAYGWALGVGVLMAILMYVEGLLVIMPTGKKLLATMQTVPAGAPPSAETQAQLAALGKKVGIASMTSLLMGTIALGAMAWAVNTVR